MSSKSDKYIAKQAYEIVKFAESSEEKDAGLIRSLVSDPGNDQPFYAVDVGDIIYKIKLWRLKMRRVTPFYAVKCNPTPVLLELLAGLGLGFDCASKAEIDYVSPYLSTDQIASRIIYANPCKTASFIRHARHQGVKMMTFDNEVELYKVKELHPNAELVIRIRVDDSGSLMSFGEKFGVTLDAVPNLLDVAKRLALRVVGVSFHVGSGCGQPDLFHGAIKDARFVFDLATARGFEMRLLNIGGGFPGNRGCQVLFDRISTVVSNALEEFFPDESSVQVIAEPGRFMVASAFTLFTTVIAKRENPNDIMYYINDGVYGSFNCIIFDHYVANPLLLDHPADNVPVIKSSVWGPTCDSMDKICNDVYLPRLDVGSWILFENMGAYTMCAASNFNGFEKPELKFIISHMTALYLQTFSFWESFVKQLGECYHDNHSAPITSCTLQANAFTDKKEHMRVDLSA